MVYVDKNILNEATKDLNDDLYADDLGRWADTVEEGVRMDQETAELLNYVKQRLSAISGYSNDFFREKALDYLIIKLLKEADVSDVTEVDDNLIGDLINDIRTIDSENMEKTNKFHR